MRRNVITKNVQYCIFTFSYSLLVKRDRAIVVSYYGVYSTGLFTSAKEEGRFSDYPTHPSLNQHLDGQFQTMIPCHVFPSEPFEYKLQLRKSNHTRPWYGVRKQDLHWPQRSAPLVLQTLKLARIVPCSLSTQISCINQPQTTAHDRLRDLVVFWFSTRGAVCVQVS